MIRFYFSSVRPALFYSANHSTADAQVLREMKLWTKPLLCRQSSYRQRIKRSLHVVVNEARREKPKKGNQNTIPTEIMPLAPRLADISRKLSSLCHSPAMLHQCCHRLIYLVVAVAVVKKSTQSTCSLLMLLLTCQYCISFHCMCTMGPSLSTGIGGV